MKEKTVIVLGNARSGTSMASGLLSAIGVNMHHQHNPNPGNPKGAYEDVNFITLTMNMHRDLKRDMKIPDLRKKYSPRIKELCGKRWVRPEK